MCYSDLIHYPRQMFSLFLIIFTDYSTKMSFEFVIPVSKDDLLNKTGVNQFVIDEILSHREIPGALQDFKLKIRSNGHRSILTNFDVLFTVLCLKDVNQDLKEDAWQLILTVGKALANDLSGVLDDGGLEKDQRKEYLNLVKMGRATKKKPSSSGINWEVEREAGLKMLLHIVSLNLQRLWDPPIAEEEFVNMVTNCCYKCLENPTITRATIKDTRDVISNIIGVMVKRYNHALGASLKILQLLQHFEHLVIPLAYTVEVITNDYGVKSVVSEIMREIGRMDPKDVARDSSGTRACSQFLVELSERIPATVLSNISVILCYLEQESYTMRNGVLEVMGHIHLKVLSKDDLDSKMKAARDQFLEKLEDHIHDVNAFVRSKVLQIWLLIVNEKCLPLPKQHSLAKLVIGRLQDKSSQVRKNAVLLVTALIKSNPFAAKVKTITDKVEEEWKMIEDKLQKALSEMSEDEDEDSDVDLIADHETCDSETEDSSENENKIDDVIQSLKSIFCDQKRLSLVVAAEAVQGSQESQDDAVVNEVSKQQDSLAFASEMQTAVPIICQLLGSKTVTDVLEAIEFFVTGFEFGLTACMLGVRRMLPLIWSKESGIKEAVVMAYKRLYLKPKGGNQRANALAVVKNLSALTCGASLGDITSLEGLIAELMRSGEIDNSIKQVLWERFTLKIPNITPEDSRAAILILSMAAGAEMNIVKINVDVLVKEGLGERAESDFQLARDTCLALLKLGTGKKKQGGIAPEPFRLPQDHEMFTRLQHLLITGVSQVNINHWIPFAEQAINVIYKLAEHPDSISSTIIKKLSEEVVKSTQKDQTSSGSQPSQDNDKEQQSSQDNDNDIQQSQNGQDSQQSSQEKNSDEGSTYSSVILTRLLSVVGHVAFRQLVHLDTSVFGELKRRHAVQESKKDSARETKKHDKTPKPSASDTPSASKTKESTTEAIEDELGLAGAAAEDAEAEYIRKICEFEVVTGQTLLGVFGPLLVAVCTNQSKYNDPNLRTAATLAMAKFMLVSSTFCDNHLQLLFTILEKSPNATIRANTIVALGDLSFRFPNLIEPWTPHIYGRLRDESPKVRKNTLQILTHLILNDMIKVKGQISEMATCVVDHDERISSLAKLFFSELSKKGNAVYNIMPDVISRLSDPDTGVDEDSFRIIMKYLFSFIQKDKQCESLVEKLCHRFRATRTERQWRDIAFCLSMLSYSDKSLRKLQENFTCFGDKLVDDNVYSCFTTIISKSRSFAKPEAKALIDEIEQKIQVCHTKGMEDDEISQKASQAATKNKGKTPAKNTKTPGKQVKSRGRRRFDSSDEDDDVLNNENVTPLPRQSQRVTRKPKPKVSFSSDEDSDIELFEVDDSKKGGGDYKENENLQNSEDSDSEPIPIRRSNKKKKKPPNSAHHKTPLFSVNSPA
ncbi:hypothetical protein KUTeg_002212 [Tegillarca granosa]|uniref:Condensin complex subunit 1 n=1 Tax=Tegillarca granosa TaxID=220873 RepID=A0ABQ9FY13_TEGGR|nr:hypothetical protein KUTeg_002212 [Tegillarca granosa]